MSKKSPFDIIHQRMGAIFAEYDGWSLPKDFGHPSNESAALDTNCAAFDLSSFGRITVKGNGGEELLGALLPSSGVPEEGTWLWADLDAEHRGSLRIGRVKGSFLIMTVPAIRESVYQAAVHIADERQIQNALITDITEKTGMLGLYGPQSVRAVNNILPFDISSVATGSITIMSFFMISVTILGGAWTGGEGVELVCPVSAAAMAAGAMAKYHERENITAAGMDCLLGHMK